ncbi:hypothetical protein T4D_13784, partial [Trichinella pseudospiralis]
MFNSNIECLQKLGKANVEMTCHLTDQNYRCASSVQTIFSISSFLLFRLHTASTVVQRWSTSVVVNSNLHCLVSVYSAPLQADATF